jgi:cytidylate kinase
MRNNLIDATHEEKVAMLDHISLHYAYNQETEHDDIYLNGENVEKEIRSKKVAMQIYKIANIQGIRDFLGNLQFEYGKNG